VREYFDWGDPWAPPLATPYLHAYASQQRYCRENRTLNHELQSQLYMFLKNFNITSKNTGITCPAY